MPTSTTSTTKKKKKMPMMMLMTMMIAVIAVVSLLSIVSSAAFVVISPMWRRQQQRQQHEEWQQPQLTQLQLLPLCSISSSIPSSSSTRIMMMMTMMPSSSLLFNNNFAAAPVVVALLLLVTIVVEIGFYFVCKLYLVPRANDHPSERKPTHYRDYPETNQRHLLLQRILDRIERNSKLDYGDEEAKEAMRDETRAFLLQWFSSGGTSGDPTAVAAASRQKQRQQWPDGEADEVRAEKPPAAAIIEDTRRRCSSEKATTTADDDYDDDDGPSFIKEVRKLIRRLPSGEMYLGMPSSSHRVPPSRAVSSSFLESEFESSSCTYEEEEEVANDEDEEEEEEKDDDSESLPTTTNNDIGAAITITTSTSCTTAAAGNNKVKKKNGSSTTTTTTGIVEEQQDDGCSSGTTSATQWTIEGLYRHNADEFFSWAFFEKNYDEMCEEEINELGIIYSTIQERCYGLVFPSYQQRPSSTTTTSTTINPPPPPLQPRRLSLEDLLSTRHRPLMVYLVVIAIQAIAAFLLKHVLGFERVVSPSTGLKAWYYPGHYQYNEEDHREIATTTTSSNSNGTKPEEADNNNDPILFFHGIAPAGYVFYLPMILYLSSSTSEEDNNSTRWFLFWRRKRRKRPLVLFENPNISCRIGFEAFSEMETVRGVEEIAHMTLSSCPADTKKDLVLIGHSFGSCPLTWLLHSSSVKFKSRIKRVALIDPVTILLSEPDVMNNFLYSSPYDASRRKIRTVASSELFTEYYLRRHFAWYNSELWLSLSHSQQQQQEDNAAENNDDFISCSANNMGIIKIVVALSGRDEIVNSQKVYRELEQLLQNQSKEQQQPSTAATTNTTTTTNSSHEHFGNNVNQLQLQRVVYWDQSRHAGCVSSPTKWEELRQQAMLL